jgi:hypothetical protein
MEAEPAGLSCAARDSAAGQTNSENGPAGGQRRHAFGAKLDEAQRVGEPCLSFAMQHNHHSFNSMPRFAIAKRLDERPASRRGSLVTTEIAQFMASAFDTIINREATAPRGAVGSVLAQNGESSPQ